MRRRLAKVLRGWADRLAPQPPSMPLPSGAFYFDHVRGVSGMTTSPYSTGISPAWRR